MLPKSKSPILNSYIGYKKYTQTTISQVDIDNEDNNDEDTNAIIDYDVHQVLKVSFNNVIFEAAMNEVHAHPEVIKAPTCIIWKIIYPYDYNNSFSACKFCNNKFCCNLAVDTISLANQILKKKSEALQCFTKAENNATINSLISYIQESINSDFWSGNNKE